MRVFATILIHQFLICMIKKEKGAVMKYSFDRFDKFIKENEGIYEVCHARVEANLGCEGCKFESDCKEFF